MKHNIQNFAMNKKYEFLLVNLSGKIVTALLMILSATAFAQDRIDSLKEQIEVHEGKLNSMDETLLTHESDLSKLTKIKFSGYIQSQFDLYQSDLVKVNGPYSTFYIRRARIKLTYEATDGVKFVLQPDYSTGNLSIKDAYLVANLPSLKSLALYVGQFNRINYEVEYSSSSREVLERSRMIRNIYPGEREIGTKLEFQPSTVPIKLQMAVLNGNFTGTDAKDVDTKKDIMARAVYSFKFPSSGIGIDLGAHAYYGGVRAQKIYVNNYEGLMDSTATNLGSYLDKKWAGAEIQAYIDFLGGMSIKGEYIQGKNASIGDSKTNPYKTRNFAGYYAYLIKNIGPKNQFVVKYDYFDPNTKLSGDGVLSTSDLAYTTLTLSWQYYLNDFIRISVNYEMPKNETISTNATYSKDLKDNTLGIRFQAKF
jgi:phosphate-selective porin